LKLTWLGHSSFRLEESTGTSVVTDPFHPYVGYEMPNVEADIVTISHGHQDHSYLSAISGNPTVIRNAGFYEIGGVHMLAQKSFHDESKGAERGSNLLFKFRMDGVEVCHMGDVGEECSVMLVESIMPVNVLLIPVGGKYTINAEHAKEYVDRIMPDVVIPMPY
jgi:L-ascorbate metabolism protein UlaG (beta-lactamase superfamily)